eukprot:3069853-Pyramimonas_sp.AAC.1
MVRKSQVRRSDKYEEREDRRSRREHVRDGSLSSQGSPRHVPAKLRHPSRSRSGGISSSTPCSSSTDSKIDTLIGNMEMLSQLVANQTVDMNSIKEACKVSADRCAALTDQMTLISREYHSRHQELQASVTASLNALDYRMGVLENCGGDSHMSDAADPTL